MLFETIFEECGNPKEEEKPRGSSGDGDNDTAVFFRFGGVEFKVRERKRRDVCHAQLVLEKKEVVFGGAWALVVEVEPGAETGREKKDDCKEAHRDEWSGFRMNAGRRLAIRWLAVRSAGAEETIDLGFEPVAGRAAAGAARFVKVRDVLSGSRRVALEIQERIKVGNAWWSSGGAPFQHGDGKN